MACSSVEECNAKKRTLDALLADYQNTYSQLQRLKSCENQTVISGWNKQHKRARITKKELPPHCNEDTLEENNQRLLAALKRTARALFEDFQSQ